MSLDAWYIVAHAVNFVVLFVFLRFVLYKPISKYLSARRERFEQERKDIEQKREQVVDMERQYKDQMEQYRLHSAEQMQESARRAGVMAGEILAQAQGEAATIIDHARKQMEAERQRTIEGMSDQVVELAAVMAGQILNREINSSDQKKLVNEFIDKLKG